jgi:tape measure domain-containing protein
VSSAIAASFYFDLASPLAYLAAERILHELPVAAEWQPVLAAELDDRHAPAAGDGPLDGEDFRAELVRRARELDLQPLRWPEPFPFDSSLAMRVATYAKSIGRTVPFAQAAFRQAFAGGHSLENADYVLIAAAACEMHPAAVLRGAELRSVSEQLSAATAAAAALGVTQTPAIALGDASGVAGGNASEVVVFQGEHALELASAHLRATPIAAQATTATEPA